MMALILFVSIHVLSCIWFFIVAIADYVIPMKTLMDYAFIVTITKPIHHRVMNPKYTYIREP
mgnify:CR=1 FL=1